MIFKLLLDKSPICFAQVDLDKGILYANPALCAFTGYSCEELKSKQFSEITHPDDIEKDILEFERLVKREITEYRLQKRYLQKSGKMVWGDLFVTIIPDELRDSYFSILAYVVDITEQKKAEIELKENEAFISHAEEIAKMGSWEWDILKDVTKWSANLYRLFKVKPEDIEPSFKYFMSKVHPDDHFLVSNAFEYILKEKKQIEIELRILLPENEILWIQNNIEPFFENDQLILLKGVNIDITEREKAEIALLENRDFYRFAQKIAKMGSWEYDLLTQKNKFSTNLYQMLQYHPEEITPSFEIFRNRIHPDDREIFDSECNRTSIGQESKELELRLQLPDGQII